MTSISKMAVQCPPEFAHSVRDASRVSLYADSVDELKACADLVAKADELIIPLDLLTPLSELTTPDELNRLAVKFTESGGGWKALAAHHDFLARPDTRLIIPTSLLSLEEVKVALSTGIAINVYVDDIGPSAAESMHAAAQYFLHEPTVRVPMEPIGFLIKALGGQARRASVTLWDLQRERNGRHLFIARDGQVSLSQRVLDEGLVFSTTTADKELTMDAIEDSHAFNRLEAISTELFRTRAKCTTCTWFRECEGYFTTFSEYRKTGCDHWQGLFKTLRDEATALRSARQQLVSPGR